MDAKQALDFAINLLELRQTSERKGHMLKNQIYLQKFSAFSFVLSMFCKVWYSALDLHHQQDGFQGEVLLVD